MRRTRIMLFAVAAAIASLVLVTLPSTASAEQGTSPADAYPQGVVAAEDAEFNQAVAGNPPSGMPCVSTTGAIACFEALFALSSGGRVREESARVS